MVDETWRERGFKSRSEFIRYSLRDTVNHPEGAGVWKDIAITEAQFEEGEGISSEPEASLHSWGAISNSGSSTNWMRSFPRNDATGP